jgi:3-dehydroquinate synthase
MIAAAQIAQAVGRCENSTRKRITEAVLALGSLPKVSARSSDILRLLQADKKTRNGTVHFVLPCAIGKVEVVSDVPEQVITDAVDSLRELSKRG